MNVIKIPYLFVCLLMVLFLFLSNNKDVVRPRSGLVIINGKINGFKFDLLYAHLPVATDTHNKFNIIFIFSLCKYKKVVNQVVLALGIRSLNFITLLIVCKETIFLRNCFYLYF